MTNTNDTVTTWRDLAPQLTPEQLADMRIYDRDISPYQPSPEVLIRIARGMVQSNLDQIRFAHVPVPADALDAPGPWEDLDEGGLYQRCYLCWRHPGVPEAVQVLGYQRSDGTITRSIIASTDLEDVDAGTARAIAAALVLAADALDSLDGGAR